MPWRGAGIRAMLAPHNMRHSILSLLLVSLAALPACTKSDRPDARAVVTAATCDQLLQQSAKPVVLDFWASWCGPCRMMDPIFAEVSVERPDFVFGKVNVDEQPKLAQRYEISAIPTVLVIVKGKVVKTNVGAISKAALLQLLDAAAGTKPST